MNEYSAVATTGIHCRPGCGARPHPRNVTSYPFAAAAEAAGYRACLRCRPYRTERPLRWVGSELLCRAIQLIVDGALDGRTEPDLAARLGISPRHLRRLFVEHVGATPDQLARSRRAHFARRLLDDTDLTITDVAFASGFGSVRQLNRVFHTVFRASPSQLRARRRSDDRILSDGALTLRLPFEPPLDWEGMLAFHADDALAGVERVTAHGYRRSIVVGDRPGALEITPGGPDHLLLRAHLPSWRALIHVVQQARRIFGLDADPTDAVQHLVDDPTIGPLVAASEGLRLPGSWEPYEVGVAAIVRQRMSSRGAARLLKRLVERYGVPAPELARLGLRRLFPPAERVAEADLTSIGFSAARAHALAAFARAVATGQLRLDRSSSLDELVGSAQSIRGLGSWAAHYLALRIGEPDAFPLPDGGLRRAVERLRPPASTVPDLAVLAEPWRPWRAHAAMRLWRCRIDVPVGDRREGTVDGFRPPEPERALLRSTG